MKNEEIAAVFKEIKTIQSTHSTDFQKQQNSLNELQKKLGLYLPHTLENRVQERVFNLTRGIHSFLQSNMMLNACVSAKKSGQLARWACFWAMVAATAACIGVVIALLK